jgi:hypothetical protein
VDAMAKKIWMNGSPANFDNGVAKGVREKAASSERMQSFEFGN